MLLLPHPSGFIINIFCGPLTENDDVKAADERCAGFNPDIAFGPLTEMLTPNAHPPLFWLVE